MLPRMPKRVISRLALLKFLVMMDSKECIDCKLFPICEGGGIWERHKNIFEGKEYDYLCHTRKENMDRSFELHYEQMLSRKA